jgi:hypothetical protein
MLFPEISDADLAFSLKEFNEAEREREKNSPRRSSVSI